jgi:glycosyltransferase involved in cell wall biosynthesis
LILNTFDQRGGAARAVWRLFEGLRAADQDVYMLVQERRSDDPKVVAASWPLGGILNPVRPYIDFAIPLLQTRKRIIFSSSLIPDRIVSEMDRINPDVVHLNWITGGFIRIESLAKIGRPTVWTLHDMWGLTGGCHYASDCKRYLESCGKCPVLHSSREHDLSRRVFLRKKKTYPEMQNLIVTTPSRWMAQQVMQSPLLGNRKVVAVPNGLDTTSFRSSGRLEARERLLLDQGKKIILFGAIRATETPVKGFALLVRALKSLNMKNCQLVVFGSADAGKADVSGLDIRFIGHVHHHDVLVDLYSAADVVAVPSMQEVFGQAATEAMACGTPVVAFACTGLLDIVVHLETGYLAKPFETEDLAAGIEWILGDEKRRLQLGVNARNRVMDHFDSGVVAKQMITVYQEAKNADNV